MGVVQRSCMLLSRAQVQGNRVLAERKIRKQSLLSGLEVLEAQTRSAGGGREMWVGSILGWK